MGKPTGVTDNRGDWVRCVAWSADDRSALTVHNLRKAIHDVRRCGLGGQFVNKFWILSVHETAGGAHAIAKQRACTLSREQPCVRCQSQWPRCFGEGNAHKAVYHIASYLRVRKRRGLECSECGYGLQPACVRSVEQRAACAACTRAWQRVRRGVSASSAAR